MDGAGLIAALQLEPHGEGGYFRRTYCATAAVTADGEARPAMSSIFYLLTRNSPVGHLHRNRSDILHYWQLGSALRYWLISPAGELRQVVLGPDLANGQMLQLLVPGGWWKGAELVGGEFGLLSEAVCPGFDFRDHEFADAAASRAAWPAHWPLIAHLCRALPSPCPSPGGRGGIAAGDQGSALIGIADLPSSVPSPFGRGTG